MKIRKCPTEKQEAITLADQLAWWKAAGKISCYSHLANESPAHLLGSKIAQGLMAGVPDYIVVLPAGRGVMFVELKAMDGKPSVPQMEWINALDFCDNVGAKVCYGANEAIAWIEEFI